MAVSFRPLWVTLKRRGLKKMQLAEMAHIHNKTITRMSHDGSVTTDSVDKVCAALGCALEDVIEYIPDKQV